MSEYFHGDELFLAYSDNCDRSVQEANQIKNRPSAEETLGGIELLTFGSGIESDDVPLIEDRVSFGSSSILYETKEKR